MLAHVGAIAENGLYGLLRPLVAATVATGRRKPTADQELEGQGIPSFGQVGCNAPHRDTA